MGANKISGFIATALATVCLIAAVASISYGQTASGTIGGTITDASGALVPGAKVTITRTSTGVHSETVTNQVGDYRVPFLTVGTYSVRIEAPGFKVFLREGIILRVDEVLHIDARLEVGSVQQQVTVTGALPLLNTNSGSTGNVIENERIVNMPLNGRNFLQLTQLTADVNQGPKSGWSGNQFISPAQKGVTLSANGARDTTTSFQVDGASARGGYLGTITLIPSIDTIQEFEMSTGSFNARDGTSPVFLKVATKTGTNAVHGSAYEFTRQASLNAQNAFATAATRHLPWHQHNFGVTIGGPVVLPHYNGKDKTFFFFGYEGNRQLYKNPKNLTVPQAAIRQGDFSSLLPGTVVKDPLTGTPFTNNVIPTNRIQDYVKYIEPTFGLPNLGATTWSTSNPYVKNENQITARFDQHFRANDQLYVRYGDTRPKWEQPPSGVGNPNFEAMYTQNGYNLLVGETHGFSPQVFNEFRFAYNQSIEGSGPVSGVKDYGPLFKWGGVPQTVGMPIVIVGSTVVADQPPAGSFQKAFQFSDNLSIHHGRHSITAGMDIYEQQNLMHNPGGFTPPYPRASVTFTNRFTGHAYGDFLLGYPYSGSNTISPSPYISPPMNYSYPDFNFYVQDDWKVNRRLTLNIGLRYEKVPVLQNPAMRSFLFQTGQLSPQGAVMAFYNSPNTDFAPRFGFAWQPFENGRTVIRGGYGWYFGRVITYGPAQLALQPPAVLTVSMSNATATGPAATTMANFLSASAPTTQKLGGMSMDHTFTPTPLTQIRSFDIQHQLPAGFMVDVGYKGSLTIHEDGLVDENSAVPGPGDVNARRPYPAFGGILTLLGVFNANYNAGIVNVEKRMGRGLSLLASFAYSKCIDQLGVPITQSEEGNGMMYAMTRDNLGLERGLCGMDNRLRNVYSFMYQLPVGRGKRFLSSGGPLAKVLGDWAVSGIATFSDGEWESVQESMDISNTGTGSLQRPDAYCNPNWPLSKRTTGQWFNAACFGNLALASNPPYYHWGTAARAMIELPGINNWDIAVMKDVSVTERVRFQFRAESFNTMNHVPYGSPNGTMNSTDPTCVGWPCQGDFPTIKTAGNPRQVQLALKLLW